MHEKEHEEDGEDRGGDDARREFHRREAHGPCENEAGSGADM